MCWPRSARYSSASRCWTPRLKTSEIRIGGDPNYTIIFEEMKRLGYVEGVNLTVDRYSAEGRFDRYPELAKAIVATRPDVISTYGSLRDLLSETRTIPIVAWVVDPIGQGIVSSLARPGGNVTGVSNDAGADMGAKRIELFSQAVGKLTNICVLGTCERPYALIRQPGLRETEIFPIDPSSCKLLSMRRSTGELSVEWRAIRSMKLRSSRQECNTPIAYSLVNWHGNIVFPLSAGTQLSRCRGAYGLRIRSQNRFKPRRYTDRRDFQRWKSGRDALFFRKVLGSWSSISR